MLLSLLPQQCLKTALALIVVISEAKIDVQEVPPTNAVFSVGVDAECAIIERLLKEPLEEVLCIDETSTQIDSVRVLAVDLGI